MLQYNRFDYYSVFDKELNCLPNSIENIKFPKNYNLQNTKIPDKFI